MLSKVFFQDIALCPYGQIIIRHTKHIWRNQQCKKKQDWCRTVGTWSPDCGEGKMKGLGGLFQICRARPLINTNPQQQYTLNKIHFNLTFTVSQNRARRWFTTLVSFAVSQYYIKTPKNTNRVTGLTVAPPDRWRWHFRSAHSWHLPDNILLIFWTVQRLRGKLGGVTRHGELTITLSVFKVKITAIRKEFETNYLSA